MFLRPQHFQQQDRWVETLVRARTAHLRPYGWGLTEIRLNANTLATGKLALSRAVGVLPDGTPFATPDESYLPAPLDVPEDARDSFVHLVLAMPGEGVAESGGVGQETTRLVAEEVSLADSAGSGALPANVTIGRKRLRLVLGEQDGGGFSRLAVARIVDVRPDRTIRLDPDYIPPCLDTRASEALSGILADLIGRFRQRGEALARSMTQPNPSSVTAVADLLTLQLVNATEPVLQHLSEIADLHPQTLYVALVSVASGLATFCAREKRPPAFPPYRHEDLRGTFQPVVSLLRQYLSLAPVEAAIAIPLEDRGYGIRVGWLEDPTLLSTASFVLAVKADMPTEALRQRFPNQVRIAPVDRIRELVTALVPGISLSPLPVTPPQLPPRPATHYFELNTSDPLWRELSNGFAFQIAGNFPGLELSFWAIRG